MEAITSFSEISEIPCIIKQGKIINAGPELRNLSGPRLRSVANALNGEVAYVKMRATYTIPEQSFCMHYDCYSLSAKEKNWCADHED